LPAQGRGRDGAAHLRRICEGGIYDQLGGGFCRYSVDAEWTIPHFEKMLYDNGPLLGLLADAWLQTRDPLYARCAGETAGWIMREMQSPRAATTHRSTPTASTRKASSTSGTATRFACSLTVENTPLSPRIRSRRAAELRKQALALARLEPLKPEEEGFSKRQNQKCSRAAEARVAQPRRKR